MKTTDSESTGYIRRFSLLRVLEHQANALAFSMLVLTGLAQRYYDSSWGEWVILALGGIDSSRLIHRYTGLLFGALLLTHVATAVYGMLISRWRPSMVINAKDFTDAIDNIRYYLGLASHGARCDRYDYKQKFEYWGVVVGGMLMLGTGLTLWFSTEIFALLPFLPGQIIPAAKAAHTNEALLAFLVIIIWHIYNAIFSPEVFPLDTAIFTGKISVKRMLHEHPLEYERIAAQTIDENPAVQTSEKTVETSETETAQEQVIAEQEGKEEEDAVGKNHPSDP